MTGGRPLRFLAIVLGGWAAIRVAVLMPAANPVPAVMRGFLAPAAAAVLPMPVPTPRAVADRVPTIPVPTLLAAASRPMIGWSVGSAAQPRPAPNDPRARDASAVVASIPPPLPPTPPSSGTSRLSGSAWLLARGGAGGTVSGGQLGASQAGMRVLYALGAARRVSIAARLATPMRGKGREAAIGLDWRPGHLPIRLIAEQRFALDGGRGGPTVGVIGGYGPADIARGVRVEAYGQAGAIARDGIEGFVDAAARLSHPVAHIGDARLDIGLGAWGSAQRAAERFDVGASIGAVLPVAGRALRLNLDWRQRVAGQARPGSGPALSIGSDF